MFSRMLWARYCAIISGWATRPNSPSSKRWCDGQPISCQDNNLFRHPCWWVWRLYQHFIDYNPHESWGNNWKIYQPHRAYFLIRWSWHLKPYCHNKYWKRHLVPATRPPSHHFFDACSSSMEYLKLYQIQTSSGDRTSCKNQGVLHEVLNRTARLQGIIWWNSCIAIHRLPMTICHVFLWQVKRPGSTKWQEYIQALSSTLFSHPISSRILRECHMFIVVLRRPTAIVLSDPLFSTNSWILLFIDKLSANPQMTQIYRKRVALIHTPDQPTKLRGDRSVSHKFSLMP